MGYNILILGGTTQARQFAEAIAGRAELDCVMSLAGRTRAPVTQPVPVRVGGFGGVAGLAAYLRQHRINVLVDATHPFAATISANAAAAVRQTGTAHFAIRRPPWCAQAGDLCFEVDDLSAALDHGSIGGRSRRIFAALGRQELQPLITAPQHYYLIRSIEAIEPRLNVPRVRYVLDRGPFALDDEMALLRAHNIDLVIAKNSGGDAAYAKLRAARELGIEVCLIKRPVLPEVASVDTIEAAVSLLDHMLSSPAGEEAGRVVGADDAASDLGMERGE